MALKQCYGVLYLDDEQYSATRGRAAHSTDPLQILCDVTVNES